MKILLKKPYELSMWLIITFISLISVFLYCTSDICVTASHGIYLLDSLFKGEFFELYTNYYNNPNTITAMYDIALYIVFAIWNIPVFALYKLGNPFLINITTLTVGTMLWNKLLILIFVLLYCLIMKSIMEEFDIARQDQIYLYYLTFTSFMFVFPVLMMGEYDIIQITFSLLGILGYIRSNNKLFLISFIIAISMKYFALFIFIPLLLLKIKNIFKIGVIVLISLCGPILNRIIFAGDSAYQYSKAFSEEKTMLLLENKVIGNFQQSSIILLLFLIIFLICYYVEPEKIDIKRYVIYIPALVYATMFGFMKFGTYWLVMLIPYITLLILTNSDKKQTNLLLLTLVEISALFLNLYFHHDNLDGVLLERGIFRKIFNGELNFSFYSLINNYQLDKYIDIFIALFIASLIVFLYINCPRNVSANNKFMSLELDKYNKFVIFIRSSIIVAFILFSILTYYINPRYEFAFSDMMYRGKIDRTLEGTIFDDVAFGPYCVLNKGKWIVTIKGKGFEQKNVTYTATCDKGNKYLDINEVYKDDEMITFELLAKDNIYDVEFPVYTNDGGGHLQLNSITVKRY